ncbi:dimethylaniline monooxygenase [Sodiomyces alkalinus F11]|uniref:Dimethylaniline monooxygenase n=1 Tax=Sodiomyces alkalinus (strain CBS 110278 / VKM F-3762 / F11) TaxID=1314773 RepID=A0A3N2Q350_SODAK|nr:dimethylaniline monooxygenase [Sodiomyces alkalinus F11]ROT41045.1 dimethylaniline monooxygenase [Sodiomyces alkalinus F11]
MRVAVIGGGPSGLVTLKYLSQAGDFFPGTHIEAKLFEAASQIGGIFYHHVYEDAELVSSKFLTSFSDFRPRRDDPDFLSAERYLEYLNQYASAFDLWPHIHLSTRVLSVRRGGDVAEASGHVVTYRTPEGEEVEWECDAVAVCSGLHQVPNIPDLPGVENVPVVMHSADFKSREQFGVDKTVLVLGCGETSFDIAALAIRSPTKRVVLCHRNGWLAAPKKLANTRFLPKIWKPPKDAPTYLPESPPVDVSHLSLFDTMYVHPIVRDSMIVWDHYDKVAVGSAWISTGAPHGFDQFIGAVPPEKFHASRLFFNKAWPNVNKHVTPPWRPRGPKPLPDRIREYILHTPVEDSDKIIDLAPFPSHIDPSGVAHFQDNGREEYHSIKNQLIKPDVLIFATGYLQSFPFLPPPANQGRKPYPLAHDTDVRAIWKRDDPTVAFIGFVRPGFGAIPPLSELQAMLWIAHLLGRVRKPLLPEDEWHYRLIAPPAARLGYGVEHDSYAYQLALDMDAAPSFTQVVRLGFAHAARRPFWRLPWIWAAAPNFTVKFRLVGPWAWPGAVQVMTEDLWEVITRRKGVFSNFTLAVIPMIQLGLASAYYLVYARVNGFLSRCGLAKPFQPVNEPKRQFEELARKAKAMEAEKMNGTKKSTTTDGTTVDDIKSEPAATMNH